MRIEPIQTSEQPVIAGQTYRFEARSASALAVPMHVAVVLEFYAKPGIVRKPPEGFADNLSSPTIPISRHYLLPDSSPGIFAAVHTAPADCDRARICIYHWSQMGSPAPGPWQIHVQSVTAPPARAPVTLAVAHQSIAQPATIEANLAICAQSIRDAHRRGVDLLCLSEAFADRGTGVPLERAAMTLDDARLAPVFAAVREAQSHVVMCIHERADQHIYTSSILIGPEGKIIGVYRKNFLTQGELERGLTAGIDLPVFDTPLGRIGMLVCWDMWFPETAMALAKRGAQILAMPIAGDGSSPHFEHTWRTRAMDHQLYVLASITHECGGEAPSRVIGPDGSVLAQTREPNGLAIARAPVPAAQLGFWVSMGPCWSEYRNVLEGTRQILGRS